MNFKFFYFTLLFVVESRCDWPTQPLVAVPNLGTVRGTQMISVSGRFFYAFRGIPYALPPVGDLRFREPVAANPWHGEIFDATREGPSCIQFHSFLRLVIGVEDCLKLNIYAHDVNVENSLKPVMVWIHGGAWSMGSGNGVTDLFGPRYFLDRDIILVTINYRLGPFGFFSTEDALAPGNYGLFDQVMALKWVRDHIRHFGGDPNLVTIFGESAGAASVNHHLISPYSKGLFHRAIAQSGSSFNPWAVEKSVGQYSRMLAETLGCSSSISSDMIACLRNLPARDLAAFRRQIEVLGIIPIAFGPRIDAEREFPFLSADPRELVKKHVNSVPTIMGVNQNEGAFLVALLLANNGSLMKKFNEDPVRYFRYLIGEEFKADNNITLNLSANNYLSFEKPFTDQLPQLEQMISDWAFFKGIDEAVHFLTRVNNKSTYYYYYKHRGEITLPTFLGLPSGLDLGVSHTDELFLLFSNDLFLPRLSSEADIKVSNMLLDLWTTFAYNGVPQSNLVPDGWDPVTEGETRYLSIDANNPRTVRKGLPYQQRIASLSRLIQ